MNRSRLLLVFVLLICSAVLYGGVEADNWPSWRGPDMMGVLEKGEPAVKWSESENIKWKVAINGDGSDSSPVVWGDRIFFQTAVKTDETVKNDSAPTEKEGGKRFKGKAPSNVYKFNLVCADRISGKTLWEKTVCKSLPHQGYHKDSGFASFSPVTDGKHVWASFGSLGVYCFDMKGELKWKKEANKMDIRNSFGEGSSPVLAGDSLIVVSDHEGDSYIRAFDKNSGKLLWKKARDEATGWTTPISIEHKGQKQIIVNGANRVRSYDPGSGDVLWQCGGQTANVIPSPVVGLDMVFCTSGFRGSALKAIKLGSKGELTDTDAVAWSGNEENTPYVPSPLFYKGRLYVVTVNGTPLVHDDPRIWTNRLVKNLTIDGVQFNGIFVEDR